jgi:hypothetical protein
MLRQTMRRSRILISIDASSLIGLQGRPSVDVSSDAPAGLSCGRLGCVFIIGSLYGHAAGTYRMIGILLNERRRTQELFTLIRRVFEANSFMVASFDYHPSLHQSRRINRLIG